ncbi:MAG: FecR domain-containing protein, partial [Myxococcales bacterium]|nr:FecR domain-containing protein [Myxococcales bacterium]
MSERRVLAPRLRELDEELAARGMPPGARARVAERLRREAIAREATAGFRFRWLPAITFAAGAALVLLVVGLGLRPRPQAIEPDPVASVLGIFTVEGEHCRYRSEAGRAVLDGSCRLVAPHLTMQTWDRVVLRDDDGLRIDEGTALLEVAHVSSGEPPVRIHVSHGTIEVIGTRFTVSQHAGGGYVDLFEGRIRFVGLGGQRREIEPGQRHAWGDAAEPEPSEVAQAELLPAAAGRGRTGAATHDGAEPDPIVVVEAEPPPVEPRAKARGSRRAAERPAKPEPVEASAEDATAIIDQVTA